MTDVGESAHLEMPLTKACELATECWRLGKLNNASFVYANDRLILERAARCLNEILSQLGVRSIDFAGTAYDPGMAPEVLDVQVDDTFPHDASVIDETISPTVMWNGKVIQAGQVVVRQAPKKHENAGDIA